MKKEVLIILAITLLIPVVAEADKSGTCGDDLTYYFNETTKTLTISGTGPMYNYSYDSSPRAPWYSYRSNIETVSIESGVTTIGTSAFYHSVNIKTVILPNSIQKIYNYAFSNCSALESIDLPPNMSFIAQEAFSNCTSLYSVSIQSVERIYLDAFKNCNNIQYVYIKNIEDWCSILFQTINSNPLSFAGHLYINGAEINDLIIPSSVSSIGCFQFYNCDGLTSVAIQNGVTDIYQSAFAGCVNINTLTIPNSITSIDERAFNRCVSLTSVISKMVNPCSISSDCFSDDVYNNATLYVPQGRTSAYKSTNYWSKFKNIEEGEPSGIAQIHENAVLIQANDGLVSISGLGDSERIAIYQTDGKQMATAKAYNGSASVATNISRGTPVIVKIGEKAVKVVMQ